MSGGDFPGAPIYVVFQDRDPNGFILKAWDTVQKQLVAERAVGFIEPRPSDLYGFALIEGDNPTTIQLWDPTEPPENPDGPPNRPKPVIGTPLTPSFHDCDSLHEARIGPFFALVRGENCGPAPYGPKLFLVTTDRNWFVWDSRAGVYQPFLIDSSHEISTEQPFQYVVYGDHFAYYDVNSHEVQIVEVNTYDRIMPIDARWSPDPNNNYFPVPLAPWNVGSWGEGEIDFARGDRDHYWDVFLSNKQTYRIFVYTRDHAKCQEGGWPYHARLKVEGSKSNFFQEVDSHPFPDSDVPDTCPGIQVSPKEYEVFNVRVDRPVTGYPGAEPPLRYYIHIEVQ